ncbi:MAG: hypothetical protein K2L81_06835, partial [Muribaculaceae bacterium]|nr:hypothetical protein [Muribaculaceae bacterium]
VYIFTDRGPYLVCYDNDTGSWVDMGYMPEFPSIAIAVHSSTTFQASTVVTQLRGAYEHGEGPLAPTDAKSITSEAIEAYRRIVTEAAQGGYMVQPALMSYRLLDSRGRVLYASSPVLVSSGGFQLTSTVSVDVNATRTQRNGHTFTANAWRPGLLLANAMEHQGWARRVAAIEVLASPQIHPLNFNLNCTGRITAEGKLNYNLPGAAATPAGTEHRMLLVRRMLERAESMMRVVDYIPRPFSGGLTPGENHRVNMTVNDDAVEQTRSMLSDLGKIRSNTQANKSELLSFPRNFTATAIARHGDTMVYANPRFLPFNGHSLQSMCSSLSTSQGGWRADIVVTMGDGSRQVVWSGSGVASAPLQVNPLLSYPSADAVKMTIFYYSPAGRFSRHELPLKGVPLGDFAYYLHHTLEPWGFVNNSTGWTTPESTMPPVPYNGYIACGSASSPLSIAQLKRVTPSEISGVTPASYSSSGFMSGNPHFYVTSADGITLVTTSVDTSMVVRASLIDRRGITVPGCITPGPECCYAIAGGSLLLIEGARVKALVPDVSARCIGWTSIFGGELWMLDNLGDVKVYHPAQQCVSRRSCTGSSLMSDGNTLYISDSHGLRRIVASDFTQWSDALIHIELSTRPMPPERRPHDNAVDTVEVPIAGGSVDATVDVIGTNHYPPQGGIAFPSPAHLLRAAVKGKRIANPRIAFRRPRRKYIHLAISANVSADTVIQ